ncbi:hypothetical protein ACB098_08G002500 [Castanea mollissima]
MMMMMMMVFDLFFYVLPKKGRENKKTKWDLTCLKSGLSLSGWIGVEERDTKYENWSLFSFRLYLFYLRVGVIH